MPIDLVIDEREGTGSTTSKSPENPDPSDLQDPVSYLLLILFYLTVWICRAFYDTIVTGLWPLLKYHFLAM
jgi:hypothetical protein